MQNAGTFALAGTGLAGCRLQVPTSHLQAVVGFSSSAEAVFPCTTTQWPALFPLFELPKSLASCSGSDPCPHSSMLSPKVHKPLGSLFQAPPSSQSPLCTFQLSGALLQKPGALVISRDDTHIWDKATGLPHSLRDSSVCRRLLSHV